jgi:hypothetical protein
MIGYPMFFQIDNTRDKCDFCGGGGKLLKALSTGKCVCPACVGHIAEAMAEDLLRLPAPTHRPLDPNGPSPF